MITLHDKIAAVLKTIQYPGYTRDIVSFGLLQRIAECDGTAKITLVIGHLATDTQQAILQDVRGRVGALAGVKTLDVEVISRGAPPSSKSGTAGRPADIRYVVAVASGKGGVGKSTVAVNLAVALGQKGLRVGLMDADVYGPSAPRMLGAKGQLRVDDGGKIIPAIAHGVEVVSMGFLVAAEKAVIWRGPMTDKLIRQFLADVAWGPLDVLVIDLPPGTGDIALAVQKFAKPDGAVIVTTPQDVAVDDARKALAMVKRQNVPMLGIVENLSYFVCDECSHHHELFGRGGGEKLANEAQVPLLAKLPMVPDAREGADAGMPGVLKTGSYFAESFQGVVSAVFAAIEPLQAAPAP